MTCCSRHPGVFTAAVVQVVVGIAALSIAIGEIAHGFDRFNIGNFPQEHVRRLVLTLPCLLAASAREIMQRPDPT